MAGIFLRIFSEQLFFSTPVNDYFSTVSKREKILACVSVLLSFIKSQNCHTEINNFQCNKKPQFVNNP